MEVRERERVIFLYVWCRIKVIVQDLVQFLHFSREAHPDFTFCMPVYARVNRLFRRVGTNSCWYDRR